MGKLKTQLLLLLLSGFIPLTSYSNNTKNLYVYVGDDNYAPYDFRIETPILGAINPILYGYLLKSNELNELSPGLISQWTYDFKEKKFIFTLGNFLFHNGRKITAADLEFSIIRGFISSSENYNKIHFSDIKGIDALKPGIKYKPGLAEGIKVLDQSRISIALKNPNPNFLINFTIPFVPLVPQEELSDDYFTWKKFPVGAGPYSIKKDYLDNRLILKTESPRDSQAQEIIIDTKRKEDKYDIIFDRVISSEKEKKHQNQFSKYPVSINSIFFYRDKPANQNIHFRKAIYHALNRDLLTEDSEQFKPAYEMLVRPYGGRTLPKNPYNLKLALSEARKIPKNLLKKEYIVGVYSSNNSFSNLMKSRINKISTMLAQVGLKIKFEANPEKFPTNEVISKFDMKLWSKVVDLADPVISYGAMSSLSPYNREIPDSKGRFDRIYESSISAKTPEERLNKIRALSQLIESEALIVPILQKYVMFRCDPEKIKSLGEQAKPLFLDFSMVELK